MDNAKLYVKQNAYQSGQASKIIEEFFPQLCWTEGENVLDVGCGPGDVSTKILLPQLPKDACLIGVDISSNMTNFANENFSHKRVIFKTQDFGSEEIHKHFPEKYFSKIFSFNCLHWIKDQKQMARNLFTLLRPGGELLVAMISASDIVVACGELSELDQFKEYCQDIKDVYPPISFSPEYLKDRLTAEGFDVVTCERRPSPFTYPSLEVATTSFEAIDPFVKRMPENVKKMYLEAFKRFISQPSSTPRILSSGAVRMFHETTVIFARRPR